jgi:hypothetical protein
MRKRRDPEPLKPPTITKAEGRRRFEKFIERGVALLAQRL